MEVTVSKRYCRQSPTKIRPNLFLIRGQKSNKAMEVLQHTNNKASRTLYQLLKSAISAASEKEMEEDKLVIKSISCDQATRLKRHIFKARGRTARITKRLSHITMTLTDKIEIKNKKLGNAQKMSDIKKEEKNIKPVDKPKKSPPSLTTDKEVENQPSVKKIEG